MKKNQDDNEDEIDPSSALFFVVTKLINFGESFPSQAEQTLMNTLVPRQKMALFFIEQKTRTVAEGITLKAVAQALDIPIPSASQLIETLVRKGLCFRVMNPGNHRSVNITLTESGQNMTKKIVSKIAKKFQELQEGLPPEEIAIFEKVAIYYYRKQKLIPDR